MITDTDPFAAATALELLVTFCPDILTQSKI